MSEHYGLWSLLPPILAISLAMATRRVVLSLLCGVVVGALILAKGHPIAAAEKTFLLSSLIDHDHLKVFGFTLLMGAMIAVIHRSGGMLGLVQAFRPLATTRRRGQLTGWLLGLVVFFDDYANTLLLGTTLRPVTDRLKISREKLAYIVDSTAAPVAGIALVSTWIATEVGLIKEGLDSLNVGAGTDDAFRIFVETISYRFYPLLALLFVGMVAWTRRDFGPMLEAERRALAGHVAPHRNGTEPHASEASPEPGHWALAIMPISVVVGVLVSVLYYTGATALEDEATWPGLWQIIGNGDSYRGLLYGSLAGLTTAVLLSWAARRLGPVKSFAAATGGARLMVPALAVLWMAWSLAAVVGNPEHGGLGTALYLSGLIGDRIAPSWMPTIVFLLASVVAFCTGTSWGTMGLLTPLVITTTWQIIEGGGAADLANPIFLGRGGSVLAGAIFGDHCSPISDTTVLSSTATDCYHVAHVWTQLPYAVLVAAASILLGTIPVGFGTSVWVALLAAAVALLVCLYLVGRRAEDSSDAEAGKEVLRVRR